jgi:hypothetical protein
MPLTLARRRRAGRCGQVAVAALVRRRSRVGSSRHGAHQGAARLVSVLSRTLNPLTLRLARDGRGPFTIVRDRGRTSGRGYETPIVGVEPLSAAEGLAAFGGIRAVVLRMLRRHEFRRFVVAEDGA